MDEGVLLVGDDDIGPAIGIQVHGGNLGSDAAVVVVAALVDTLSEKRAAKLTAQETSERIQESQQHGPAA